MTLSLSSRASAQWRAGRSRACCQGQVGPHPLSPVRLARLLLGSVELVRCFSSFSPCRGCAPSTALNTCFDDQHVLMRAPGKCPRLTACPASDCLLMAAAGIFSAPPVRANASGIGPVRHTGAHRAAGPGAEPSALAPAPALPPQASSWRTRRTRLCSAKFRAYPRIAIAVGALIGVLRIAHSKPRS